MTKKSKLKQRIIGEEKGGSTFFTIYRLACALLLKNRWGWCASKLSHTLGKKEYFVDKSINFTKSRYFCRLLQISLLHLIISSLHSELEDLLQQHHYHHSDHTCY